MKALSVRAPWWWFILHAGKDIENRDWPTGFRGTVYLHASKWWNTQDVCDDWDYAFDMVRGRQLPAMQLGGMKSFGGCIVGTIDVVDCVGRSDSPWFQGVYGFVLRNPVAFVKPIPFKGALGFFDVPNFAPKMLPNENEPSESQSESSLETK